MLVKPARVHGFIFIFLAAVLAYVFYLTLSFPLSFYFVATLAWPFFAALGIGMMLRPGSHPVVDTKRIKEEKLKFPGPKEEWAYCASFDKAVWIIAGAVGVIGIIVLSVFVRM
ncbi:MAG TPA: hypothetical protein PKK43_07860 [Spirochaetota bacterium]|nr:hypothetical protein [Spirochaetota bacterium]